MSSKKEAKNNTSLDRLKRSLERTEGRTGQFQDKLVDVTQFSVQTGSKNNEFGDLSQQ